MANNTRVREDKDRRSERVPLSEQRKNLLTVPPKEGFVRRWVNDVERGSRVAAFKRAGWRVVEDETTVGDAGVINQNESLGSGARRHMGGLVYAVLMEIEEELYREDLELKAERVNQIEASIYDAEGLADGYGKIEVDGVKRNKHKAR